MSEAVIVHPTAIVHPKAQLGPGTRVGAYSVIEEDVILGSRCDVQDHVSIKSHVRIGDDAHIFPFAAIGGEPQHTRYKGEPTLAEIGNRVIVREAATIHRGTSFGIGTTKVGDDCFLMAYSHVAHDCVVGNHIILANAVQLAGHVQIEDFVTLGGMSAVAQFCRIGRYCYLGGGTIIRKDVAPFLLGKGTDFRVQGINVVGLERGGFSPSTIQRLKKIFKIFFAQGLTISKAIEKVIVEIGESDEVKVFLDFVRSSEQGLHRR